VLAGTIDQYPAHRLSGDREEMGAILPPRISLIY
jgi:hypothetical protein